MATANDHRLLNLWVRLAAGLASLICIGFLTWAGVVYTMGTELKEIMYQVVERQAVMETKLEHMAEAWERHGGQPWHGRAGNSIASLRMEIESLRQRQNLADDYLKSLRERPR